MSEEIKPCPFCESPYGYSSSTDEYTCPECSQSWKSSEQILEDTIIIRDSNGTILQDGDSVIVMKDLPVKGAPKPIKSGTKVKNIRIVDGDHNIDCKIDGFGKMALKSEFVKKAQ